MFCSGDGEGDCSGGVSGLSLVAPEILGDRPGVFYGEGCGVGCGDVGESMQEEQGADVMLDEEESCWQPFS